MWKKMLAAMLAVALPASSSAEEQPSSGDATSRTPIRAAIDRSAVEIAAVARQEDRGRGRFWSGIALIAGGGVLTTLGAVEVGDDEDGSDDEEDIDGSDDGEDEDGWGNKAMLGGGIAAAALGGVLLLTGKPQGPSVSVKRGGFAVRHTVRF